jgi:HEAT repeat protein/PBS lyase HEAT-like repeat-containing protein
MNGLNRAWRGLVPVLALLAVASPARSADLKLPRDGWATWTVPAVDGAPAWCCFSSWRNGKGTPTACKLDGGRDGYSLSDNDTKTDAVNVYARFTGGKVDSLQVFAAACPVQSNTPIQDLGNVTAEDSTRWLASQVKQDTDDTVAKRPIAEGALAALATHRGDAARDALAGFAHAPRAETRKWSVFWLAMVRGNEGADLASPVMFNDPDPEVRQHAALALSQSGSPRVTADLVRLGNTDRSGEVRGQAWFWLAQTGAAEAEAAIGAALKKDQDDEVREQAIFALSQLPDERATRALIAAAEDRSLSREQRRRAVFWLSQSESASAQAYLEKVLARAAAN